MRKITAMSLNNIRRDFLCDEFSYFITLLELSDVKKLRTNKEYLSLKTEENLKKAFLSQMKFTDSCNIRMYLYFTITFYSFCFQFNATWFWLYLISNGDIHNRQFASINPKKGYLELKKKNY